MAVETLTDDLLVEIISRVPSRQRWRCKCVCRRWLRLARTLPQSLAGFFYATTWKKRFPGSAFDFFNVSGTRRRPLIHPSFAFLPSHRRIDLLDCCNGLLLCRWHGADELRYVVCNPATEEWVALPENPSNGQVGEAGRVRLGFDPATSYHFHVFVLLSAGRHLTGVDVYSSETRRWVHKAKGWAGDVTLGDPLKATVFLNGFLHFHTFDGYGYALVPSLAAADVDGVIWTDFQVPGDLMILDDGFIQQSQGRLHYASFTSEVGDDRLVVYVLDDYDSKEWVLKHIVKISDVFGSQRCVNDYNISFDWFGIHPECNAIFFTVGLDKPFMCYNMDSEQTRHICLLCRWPGTIPAICPVVFRVTIFAHVTSIWDC